MTQSIAIASQSTLDTLIFREKSIIEEGERMIAVSRGVQGWSSSVWDGAIRQARQRLKALQLGLLPIRITGRFFSLSTLLQEAQSIPTEIAQKAKEAELGLPGSKAVVYRVTAPPLSRESLPAPTGQDLCEDCAAAVPEGER